MKAKNLVHKGKILLASILAAGAMNTAIAQNTVSGIIQNKAENLPLQADIKLTNKNTLDEYLTKSNILTGQFTLNLPTGEYTLEAIPNFHYIFKDTNFVVNKDTSLDIRMIRGKNTDSTNYLISDHIYFKGSFLKFAKLQLGRKDNDFMHDVINWPSERRRIFTSGITGSSVDSLNDVLAVIEAGAPNIKYDKQSTDSIIGISLHGVPPSDSILDGADAQAFVDSVEEISVNPLRSRIIHASIYMRNDIPIDKWHFSRELLRAEAQSAYSPWQHHVMVGPEVTSLANIAHPDETHLAFVNQGLLTGEDWRKYKDTIGTITETFSILYEPGWSQVSVPTKETDLKASHIFPEKQGQAFGYINNYVPADSLQRGKGYWIKLLEGIETPFNAQRTEIDTIQLQNKWNMIGSIGFDVPIDSIEQIPPGILTSRYFKFNGSAYVQANTIEPGKGYWIKANQEGKLVLKKPGTGANITKNITQTQYDNDIPQAPETNNANNGLEQKISGIMPVYPNPTNGEININYKLETPGRVEIELYDMLGRKIRTITKGNLQTGEYTTKTNTTNIATGTYILKTNILGDTKIQKIQIIK